MNEIRHDKDGFLLPKKNSEKIEQILLNTEKLLERHNVQMPKTAPKVVNVAVKSIVPIREKATKQQQNPLSGSTQQRPTPIQKQETKDRKTVIYQAQKQTKLLKEIAQNSKSSRDNNNRVVANVVAANGATGAKKRDKNGRFVAQNANATQPKAAKSKRTGKAVKFRLPEHQNQPLPKFKMLGKWWLRKNTNKPKQPENTRPTPIQKQEKTSRTAQFRQTKLQTALLKIMVRNSKRSLFGLFRLMTLLPMLRLLGLLPLAAGLLAGVAKLPINLAKGMLLGGKSAMIGGRNGRFSPVGAAAKGGGILGGLGKMGGKLLKGVAKGGLLGALFGLLNGAEIENSDMGRADKNKAHAKNALVGVGGIGGAMAGAAIGSVVPVVGTVVGGILGGFGGAALMSYWGEWLDSRIPKNFSNRMFGSWDGFVGTIKDLWRNFTAKNQISWQNFMKFATETWTSFSGSLKTMASAVWNDFMPQSIRSFFENVADVAKSAWNNFSTGAAAFWDGVKSVAKATFDGMKFAFDNVIKPIGDWSLSVYNKGAELVQQGVNAWNNSSVGQVVNNVVGQGVESAKNLGGDIKEWVIGREARVTGGRSATAKDEQKLLGELQNAKLIKSSEAISGGKTNAGTYAAALDLRGAMGKDLKYFSSFNDGYHQKKSPNSKHAKGLALDMVNKSGDNKAARQQAQNIYDQLTQMGFKGKLATRENGKNVNIGSGSDFLIQDEYNRPSSKSSGGHIHFGWNSQEAANRYFAMTRGGAQVTIDTRAERAAQTAQKGANFLAEKAQQGINAWNNSSVGQTVSKGVAAFREMVSSNESKGNYNAYNQGTQGNKTIGADRKYDFSKMTLNEYLANTKKGFGQGRIFAWGKYQMIPDTTRAAMKSMGLTGNELMTPELQERMFAEYLVKEKAGRTKNGSPLYNYIIGKSNNIQAAVNATAKEWASIGVSGNIFNGKRLVTHGKGYYDGVGGNKAHTSPEKASSAINMLRNDVVALSRDKGISEAQAYALLMQGSPMPNVQVQAATLPPMPKVAAPVAAPKPTAPPPSSVAAAPTKVLESKSNIDMNKTIIGSIAHKPVSRTVDNAKLAHIASGGIMTNQH